MMEVILFRHGKTESNQAFRYCGSTDEPLCPEGVQELKPVTEACPVDKLYVSPLKRAVMTAEICFPGVPQEIAQDLREMDFGVFEGRNPQDMKDDAQYTAWVDSFCRLPCPGGESTDGFYARVCAAFERIVLKEVRAGTRRLAIVAHGGTAMAILSRFAAEKREDFEWIPKNGSGWRADVDMRGGLQLVNCVRI